MRNGEGCVKSMTTDMTKLCRIDTREDGILKGSEQLRFAV